MIIKLTIVAALAAVARAGDLLQAPALSTSYSLRGPPIARYAQIAQPIAAAYQATPLHQPLIQAPAISAYSFSSPIARTASAPIFGTAHLAPTPLASAPFLRAAPLATAPVLTAAPASILAKAPTPILAPAPIVKTTIAAAPIAKTAVNEEYDPNPHYEFGYDVHDSLTGDVKSQVESRSGDFVQGSYSLNDPDGTRRTVDYSADPINGFNAVVRKEPLALEAKAVVAAPAIAKVAAPSVFIH